MGRQDSYEGDSREKKKVNETLSGLKKLLNNDLKAILRSTLKEILREEVTNFIMTTPTLTDTVREEFMKFVDTPKFRSLITQTIEAKIPNEKEFVDPLISRDARKSNRRAYKALSRKVRI